MSRKQREPMPPRPSDTVVLATIHPGNVSAYFFTGVATTLMADLTGPKRIGGFLQEWSSANVSEARNKLTGAFLDEFANRADWLLWIDSDMSFTPDDVYQLLAAADPDKTPVLGGLCFGMASGKLWPTLWHLAEDPDGEPVTVRVDDYPPDVIFPVAATGGAFLLIHRRVLQAVKDRAFNRTFPWWQETEMNGRPVGEDITFCLRCLSVGIPVHVHTGVRIGHHKSIVLMEPMFLAQKKEAGDGTLVG